MRKFLSLLVIVFFVLGCPPVDDDTDNDGSGGGVTPPVEEVRYKVTFNYGNGSDDVVIQMDVGQQKLTDFPSEPTTGSGTYGNNFLGWFIVAQTVPDFYDSDNLFDIFTDITGDLTLYAHYSHKKVYKITFDAKGGTPATYQIQYVFEDGKITEPTTSPVKPFQVLDSWKISGAPVDFGTYLVSSDITLEATYRNYKITFQINGGEYLDGTIDDKIFDADNLGLLSSIPETPASATIDGTSRPFFGWFIFEAGRFKASVNVETVFSGDTICKANWATNQNSVNVGDLIAVSGGTFNWDDDSSDEVSVTPYYIATTEVTQKAYTDIMSSNPSYFTNPDKSSYFGNDYNPFARDNVDERPVESVTFYDAILFCNALSVAEGFEPVYTVNDENVTVDDTKNGYRLPTEAQWMWAAMCFEDEPERPFSGRESGIGVNTYSWHRGNCYSGDPWALFKESDFGTKKVGAKSPNREGFYDMSGNVWEWVFDYYGEREIGANPCCNTTSVYRVLKGGSWHTDTDYLKLNYRKKELPNFSNYLYGIRVVRGANS